MEHSLTYHDTLGLQEVMKIGGDLLLLPEQAPLPIEEARALEVAGIIDLETSSIYEGTIHAFGLAETYAQERYHNNGKEPSWTKKMPMSVRTYMRLHYALTQEDAFQIVGTLRHTGLSYMTTEGGLCEDIFHAFGLGRLNHIKQLGFLQIPIYNDYLRSAPLSESSRWVHSLDVMAIASVIGHNFKLSEPDMNMLRTLALTHDVATPAGGDSVKMVDIERLDEDANYHLILDRVDFASLATKYHLKREVLLDGIFNKGMLGEILDIADKLAYVARDIDTCRHHLEAGAYLHDHLGLQTLLQLLERFPYVCSIWDCVGKTEDGRPCFTDIRRLVAFLKVRLLLFRELYYHPASRFGEFLMSRLFVKVLYEKGTLTRDELLVMTDEDLHHKLDEEFGIGLALDTCSSELARVREFSTLEEAQAFVDTLKREGNLFVLLDDYRRSIKTGTHFLVSTPQGARTLDEADPGSAQELNEMATMLPMVHVYYLDGNPTLPREKLAELVKHFRSATAR